MTSGLSTAPIPILTSATSSPDIISDQPSDTELLNFEHSKVSNHSLYKTLEKTVLPFAQNKQAFNYNQALLNWIYNTFNIFAFPLMLKVEGYTGAYNRWFIPLHRGAQIQLFVWLCFALSIFLHFTGLATGISNFEIAMMIIFQMFRSTLIGIKYGMMPQSEIESLRKVQEDPNEMQKRHMIQGWLFPPAEVYFRELATSAQKHRYDISTETVTLSSNIQDTNSALFFAESYKRRNNESDSENNVDSDEHSITKNYPEVPILQVLGQFLLDADYHVKTTFFPTGSKIALWGALIYSGLPFFIRFIPERTAFNYSQVNTLGYIVLIANFLVDFWNLWSNYLICITGSIDFRRRYMSLSMLNSTLSVQGYTPCSSLSTKKQKQNALTSVAIGFIEELDMDDDTDIIDEFQAKGNPGNIKMNFSSPRNYPSWLIMRRILRDIGSSYFSRIHIFLAIFLVFIAALVIYLIYSTVVIQDLDFMVLILATFAMMTFAVSLIVTLKPAIQINQMVLEDTQRLSRISFYIQTKTAMHKNADNTDNKAVIALCDHLIQNIKIDSQIQPVSVMGIPVAQSMVKAVSTIVIFTVIQVIRTMLFLDNLSNLSV